MDVETPDTFNNLVFVVEQGVHNEVMHIVIRGSIGTLGLRVLGQYESQDIWT